MAKKGKKKHHKTRRRVSGINMKQIPLEQIGLGILGGVAAMKITDAMKKSTNTTMQKAAPYVPLAAGIVLPMFIKQQMVKEVSTGLAIGGGITVLKELKIISGFGDFKVINGYPKQGYMRLPDKMNNTSRGVVNGMGDNFTGKANFSGSRLNQMSVISGVHANPQGSGIADGSY